MILQYPDVHNPYFDDLTTIDEVNIWIEDTKHVLTSNLHNAVECAWKLGELLLTAKINTPHGEWLAYLDQQQINERTAQRWIRLRREIPQLSPEIAAQSVTRVLSGIREEEKATESDEVETHTVDTRPSDVVVLTATERKALERQHMEEQIAEKDQLLAQQSDTIYNLEQENRLQSDMIGRPDAAAQVQELRAAQEETESIKTLARTSAQIIEDLRTENASMKLRLKRGESGPQSHVQHPQMRAALNALLDMAGIPDDERRAFLQKIDPVSYKDGLWTDLLVKSILRLQQQQHD